MSERSVADQIRKLRDAGLIRVESGSPNGRGQFASNRYVFAFEEASCRRQDLPSAKSADGKSRRLPTARFADEHGKREIGKNTCSSAPSFDHFWSTWPLKRQGRARAEKAWRRLSESDRRAALEQVAAWAEKWRAAHPQASDIHPSTFINGRRWEDELTAPSAPAAAGARDARRASSAPARLDAPSSREARRECRIPIIARTSAPPAGTRRSAGRARSPAPPPPPERTAR